MMAIDRSGGPAGPVMAPGFSLIEVIPSLALISVTLMISMKSLLLDLRMRDLSRQRTLVQESSEHVLSTWHNRPGLAALCRMREDGVWEVLDFPDDTWLPQKAVDSGCVAWRKRSLKDTPVRMVAVEYRLTGKESWTWWISCMEMTDEPE